MLDESDFNPTTVGMFMFFLGRHFPEYKVESVFVLEERLLCQISGKMHDYTREFSKMLNKEIEHDN